MPHNQILLLEYYTQVTQLKDVLEGFFFLRFLLKATTPATTEQTQKPTGEQRGFS